MTASATAASAPREGLLVSGLRVAYEREIEIVRGVDLHAQAGHITAVIGPNGAGKSTLLNAICGLAPTVGGCVLLDERDVTGWHSGALLAIGLAFVPQDGTLFRDMSVRENLVMGGWLRREQKTWLAKRIADITAAFGMSGTHLQRRAGDLSGGQQKILEIARSLILQPRVLLLDEPTAGLSPKMADQVYAHVADLARRGMTVLMVDQNVRAALAMADRAYVLAMGRNNSEGAAADIANRLGEIVASWMQQGDGVAAPT